MFNQPSSGVSGESLIDLGFCRICGTEFIRFNGGLVINWAGIHGFNEFHN